MSNFLLCLFLSLTLVACNGSGQSSNPGFGENNSEDHTSDPVPVPHLGAADVVANQSSITSSGSIIANGVSTALVTVALKAVGGLPVEGVIPVFTATDLGANNTYGVCSSSNSLGLSYCTLASRTPGIKILHLNYPVAFDGGSIVFINDTVDYLNSSISGNSTVTADGVSQSVISIKLLDLEGNPFSGIPTFRATNTAGTNAYSTCSALNGSGESTCYLASTVAEVKRLEILSPAYFSGDEVTFVSGLPDATTSTVTTTTKIVSDGNALAVVTVTLKDAFQNKVAGLIPTFSATDTGSKNIYFPCTPSTSSGVSFCYMSSKKAEVKTVSLLTPINFAGGVTTFIGGAASATYSSINGTTNVLANGTSLSDVTITLKDAYENIVENIVPQFTATDSGSSNVYSVCSLSNSLGVSTCTMSSFDPEIKTLRTTSPLFMDGDNVSFLSPGMDIMVPIELIDRGLASATTATIFNRSLYPLVTTDYVANTNTYYFEIMAANIHTTVDYAVELLGNSNAVLATIIVPKNTPLTATTRLRSGAITMPAGTNSLKMRLAGTTTANQLVVYMAKLLIKQVGATRTKLWIPLSAHDHSAYSNVILAPVVQTAAVTNAANANYIKTWTRKDSLYSDLDNGAYKFEGLMSNSLAAGTGTMNLHNITDNVAVTGSNIDITGVAYQWGSATLTDPTTFLNNKTYEVRYRSDSTARTNYIFKAGLSVKLTNLSKAEILNRIYLRRSSVSTSLLNGGRIKWDSSDYSHSKSYLETVGSVTAGGSATRELDDMALSDSSVATPLVVTDSVLSIGSSLGFYRTPELLLTDSFRYLLYDRVNSGTFVTLLSSLVIKATLRP